MLRQISNRAVGVRSLRLMSSSGSFDELVAKREAAEPTYESIR